MERVCLVLAALVCITQAFTVPGFLEHAKYVNVQGDDSQATVEADDSPAKASHGSPDEVSADWIDWWWTLNCRKGMSWSKAEKCAERVLSDCPLVDGHNDIAAQYRVRAQNNVENSVDLNTNILGFGPGKWEYSQIDIPRLREGQVGSLITALWVNCSAQFKDAVRATFEQVDVGKRMVDLYSKDFELVTTAKGVEDAFKRGKIGILFSVEGGHQIDSSLGTLRMLRELGVTSLTLTHFCDTPWAESSFHDDIGGEQKGLSSWGEILIREMNRIGMIPDVSHVSLKTMNDVLDVSESPVMYSHSSAFALCNNNRNVRINEMRRVAENGGIVMVTFVTFYLGCAPSNGRRINTALAADHIEFVAQEAGYNHVGIGSDYDGIPYGPEDLEDVSDFPTLFAELAQRGWSKENLCKLAGGNYIRVMRENEKVSQRLRRRKAAVNNDWIPQEDLDAYSDGSCRVIDQIWLPGEAWPNFYPPGPILELP